MLLTDEEASLNTSGKLTEIQLKKIRRKGVGHFIAGMVFLILVPLSVITADIKFGPLMLIWLLSGLFFAGILFWSAKSYLLMKREGHTIISVRGAVKTKNSGSKHVLVTINERSFLLMKNESATLKDGQEYILYYLEDPKTALGWVPAQ